MTPQIRDNQQATIKIYKAIMEATLNLTTDQNLTISERQAMRPFVDAARAKAEADMDEAQEAWDAAYAADSKDQMTTERFLEIKTKREELISADNAAHEADCAAKGMSIAKTFFHEFPPTPRHDSYWNSLTKQERNEYVVLRDADLPDESLPSIGVSHLPDGWLDTYGEPQDWALAQAFLDQIRDFQGAVAILQMTDAPQQARKAAAERVKRPVVDIDAALAAAGGIRENGGWGQFVQRLRHRKMGA